MPVIKTQLSMSFRGCKLTFDNANTDICPYSQQTETNWKYEFGNSILEFAKVKFAPQKRTSNLWKGTPSQKRKMEFGKAFFAFPRVTSIDATVGDIVKNRKRRHDFRIEQLANHRKAGVVLEKGPIGGALLILRADAVKHMLTDPKYTKPGADDEFIFQNLAKWLGADGIFVLRHGDGAPEEHLKWHRQRKLASKIFTGSNFNGKMQDTFTEKAQILVDLLEKHESGEAMDMQKMFFAFTMDSIMEIFFGRKTETMKGEEDPYATAYDEAHRHMIEYSMTSIPMLVASVFLPFPFGDLRTGKSVFMKQAVQKFNSNSEPFHTNIDILTRESSKIIQSRKKDPNLHESNDLLALFMRPDMQPQVKGEASFDPYTEKELRDIVLSFIIAGRDTTACTLTWLFYMLSQNKDVEQKVLEELDRVLQGKQATRENTSANRTRKGEFDGPQMPYLNGLVYEALRLHPPVPEDIKICVKDDPNFPDGKGGTFLVPAETRLVFLPRYMGRNQEVWEEPEKVDPERWIQRNASGEILKFTRPDPFEFPVFQAGPRVCLGEQMAIFEAKILVTSLLQRFTFDLKEGEAEKITYSGGLTMSLCNSKNQDSHQLLLIPKKRERFFYSNPQI